MAKLAFALEKLVLARPSRRSGRQMRDLLAGNIIKFIRAPGIQIWITGHCLPSLLGCLLPKRAGRDQGTIQYVQMGTCVNGAKDFPSSLPMYGSTVPESRRDIPKPHRSIQCETRSSQSSHKNLEKFELTAFLTSLQNTACLLP